MGSEMCIRDRDETLLLEHKKCEFLQTLSNLMEKMRREQSSLLPPNILTFDKTRISELTQGIKRQITGRAQKSNHSAAQDLQSQCQKLSNAEIEQLIAYLQNLLQHRRTRVRSLRFGCRTAEGNSGSR